MRRTYNEEKKTQRNIEYVLQVYGYMSPDIMRLKLKNLRSEHEKLAPDIYPVRLPDRKTIYGIYKAKRIRELIIALKKQGRVYQDESKLKPNRMEIPNKRNKKSQAQIKKERDTWFESKARYVLTRDPSNKNQGIKWLLNVQFLNGPNLNRFHPTQREPEYSDDIIHHVEAYHSKESDGSEWTDCDEYESICQWIHYRETKKTMSYGNHLGAEYWTDVIHLKREYKTLKELYNACETKAEQDIFVTYMCSVIDEILAHKDTFWYSQWQHEKFTLLLKFSQPGSIARKMVYLFDGQWHKQDDLYYARWGVHRNSINKALGYFL